MQRSERGMNKSRLNLGVLFRPKKQKFKVDKDCGVSSTYASLISTHLYVSVLERTIIGENTKKKNLNAGPRLSKFKFGHYEINDNCLTVKIKFRGPPNLVATWTDGHI